MQLEKLCVILRTSIEFSYITIHDCCKSFTNLFEISCLTSQLTKQQEISNGAVSPEDLFPEANLPVYTFENRCREMPELALGDEAYKIFLNAGGNAEGMPKGLADISGRMRRQMRLQRNWTAMCIRQRNIKNGGSQEVPDGTDINSRG